MCVCAECRQISYHHALHSFNKCAYECQTAVCFPCCLMTFNSRESQIFKLQYRVLGKFESSSKRCRALGPDTQTCVCSWLKLMDPLHPFSATNLGPGHGDSRQSSHQILHLSHFLGNPEAFLQQMGHVIPAVCSGSALWFPPS